MVNYKCFRCGYETKHKANFITHLNRKNTCNPILDDICVEEIKKWYNIDVSKIKQHKTSFRAENQFWTKRKTR